MHLVAVGHGVVRRGQRLRGHLAPEHPLEQGVRLAAAEQVVLDDLEVEQCHQLVDGSGHGRQSSGSSRRARNCSNWAPISSPLGRGSSSASRLAALLW